MAHFAQLDEQNKVIQVIVVSNDVINNLPFPESEPLGVDFCQSLYGENTVWKQTSYNGNFRKIYAGIGHLYDATVDEFIPPVENLLNNDTLTIDPITPALSEENSSTTESIFVLPTVSENIILDTTASDTINS